MLVRCKSCSETFTHQGPVDTSSSLCSVTVCPNCSRKYYQCNYCPQSWIFKTSKSRFEAHAQKHHHQERQSFIDRSNHSLLVDHPPIIFESLENGDHWDHNFENNLDEDDDDDEFVAELLELDIPSLDNNATCDLVNANYAYQPPPQ